MVNCKYLGVLGSAMRVEYTCLCVVYINASVDSIRIYAGLDLDHEPGKMYCFKSTFVCLLQAPRSFTAGTSQPEPEARSKADENQITVSSTVSKCISLVCIGVEFPVWQPPAPGPCRRNLAVNLLQLTLLLPDNLLPLLANDREHVL